MTTFTIEQKLAALLDERRFLESADARAAFDAIIADYETHLPALVEAAENYFNTVRKVVRREPHPHSREAVQGYEGWQELVAALAHFTEAGGQE